MRDESKAGLLVFLGWAMVLIVVAAASGYNGLYGLDSHEYLRYCNRLVDFIGHGVPPGDYFWPVNYPLMGALLSFVTGSQIALQLISIFSASWIIYLLCMFLFREFPGREREVIFYAILFLGASPYFLRYSISSMSDIPALAFACTAYYILYLNIKTATTGLIYFTWFFASMAIFTRFALLPLMIPVVLVSGYQMIKSFRVLHFALSLTAATVPLIIYGFIKLDNSGVIFQHYLVSDWSMLNYFKNSFATLDGFSEYTIPNIVFAFSFLIHPGFLFPGTLFIILFFIKRRQPSLLWPVAVAGVLLYLFFIAGIPSRNTRYLIPVLPFYLAVCFPSFMSLLSFLHNKKNILSVILAIAVVAQGILAIRAFIPFYEYNQSEKRLAQKIIEYHPAVLYTFGIDGALRSYGYRGQIINLWDRRLESVKEDAMLLFNRQGNEQQWKGRNPMLNFYLIVDSAKAVKMDVMESGWEIYEIKEAYTPAGAGLSRH